MLLSAAPADVTDAELITAFREVALDVVRLLGKPGILAAIARVADALVERGHLSGVEVEVIVKER